MLDGLADPPQCNYTVILIRLVWQDRRFWETALFGKTAIIEGRWGKGWMTISPNTKVFLEQPIFTIPSKVRGFSLSIEVSCVEEEFYVTEEEAGSVLMNTWLTESAFRPHCDEMNMKEMSPWKLTMTSLALRSLVPISQSFYVVFLLSWHSRLICYGGVYSVNWGQRPAGPAKPCMSYPTSLAGFLSGSGWTGSTVWPKIPVTDCHRPGRPVCGGGSWARVKWA